jgi:hypothetical protein
MIILIDGMTDLNSVAILQHKAKTCGFKNAVARLHYVYFRRATGEAKIELLKRSLQKTGMYVRGATNNGIVEKIINTISRVFTECYENPAGFDTGRKNKISLDECLKKEKRLKRRKIAAEFRKEGLGRPTKYFIHKRDECSAMLLAARYPPCKIADMLGFHDSPHLSNQFNKYSGFRPGKYVKNL